MKATRGDSIRASASLDEAARAALREGLGASALWSLLLDVFERRAAERTPARLVEQWKRDGFTRPASVDQRTLVELDAELLAEAAAFEAIELSPLAPLGSCSLVAPTSQNKIVSALRGTEVVSDPTNVLALECARRLREDPGAIVRLATSQRCVRAQALPKRAGFTQHFRIFCLATAGREQKDHAFVASALVEHVATHLAVLDRLEQRGYAFPERRVKLLATPERAALGDRIEREVRVLGGARRAEVSRELLTHPYYGGLRFMIEARSTLGEHVPLMDGGAFDWVGKLAVNRRLAYVASGMGAELAARLFRPAARPDL